MLTAPNEITLPQLHAHQDAAAAAPQRHSLLRWGRRAGKDIFDLHATLLGHGPETCPHEPGACQRHLTDGTACWAGLIHGWDVVWLAPDYPQGITSFWEQEIKPRFAGVPGVALNQQHHSVSLRGLGTLWLRSAENVASIRGMGKTLAGVIVNEAAFLDLESAWRSVLRPALADNVGWSVWTSNTNSGWDGNAERATPSYFNRVCAEILGGVRDSRLWVHHYATAEDNPRISPSEFAALVAEYAPGSSQLAEEVYAELLEAGAGLAFPMFRQDVHLVHGFRPPDNWRIVAGMDWGIANNSVIVLGAVSPEQEVVWFREWVWRDKEAYQAGYDWATSLMESDVPWPARMWCDASMWQKSGIGGKTVGAEFSAGVTDVIRGHVQILPAPHGPGSRAVKYSRMLRWMGWGPPMSDGSVPVGKGPKMRFVRDACRQLWTSLAVLPKDPKSNDDVDSEADDHAYDAAGNVIMNEIEPGTKRIESIPEDTHPGYIPGTARRRGRIRTPEVEAEEELVMLQAAGVQVGGRYGQRPGR